MAITMFLLLSNEMRCLQVPDSVSNDSYSRKELALFEENVYAQSKPEQPVPSSYKFRNGWT